MTTKNMHPQRKPLRLSTHDYSMQGAYFITICTYDKQCLFGEITNGVMQSNQWGQVVAAELRQTAELRPYLGLDEHVVMPNHVHAIMFLQPENTSALGEIIRAYKSYTTRRIRQMGLSAFTWQRGYYDHVIRGEKDLQRIREYIVNNPAKWEEDRNNPYRAGV